MRNRFAEAVRNGPLFSIVMSQLVPLAKLGAPKELKRPYVSAKRTSKHEIAELRRQSRSATSVNGVRVVSFH